jgi:thymidylate kinase
VGSKRGTEFVVLLGGDYAGKSSVMTALGAADYPRGGLVSIDDAFLGPRHAFVGRLRRQFLADVLPGVHAAYSPDFALTVLQTAVVYLRDRTLTADSARPVVVDSYYYKILAKCRLSGLVNPALFAWWRSFPQPRRIVYLDVSPGTAWRRSGNGSASNPLEHYGDRPERAGFEEYQRDLRRLLLEEVRHLPVTMVSEENDIHSAARVLTEELNDDCD